MVRDSYDGVTFTFVGGGGSYQDAHSKAFLQPFAECTGATILEESNYADAKVEAMVEAGKVTWNLIAGGRNLSQKCGVLLEKYDTSKVDVSDIRFTEQVGECQIPSDLAPEYIVYDPTVFPNDPPSSMEDFFDIEKYPGKRGVYGSLASPGMSFPTAVASMLGYTEEEMFNPKFPAEEVFAKIDTIRDHIVWQEKYAQQQQAIESREVVMGFFAAGRVSAAAKNGVAWVPIWGKKGGWTFAVDSLTIPKGAPNLDATFALANFAIGPRQQALVTELTAYTGSNKNSKPNVPEIIQPYYAPADEIASGLNTTHVYWLTHADDKIKMWNDFFLGE